MVPALSSRTTGSSLPTFHHLEKWEVPLEPAFLLTVQLFYLSVENLQPLPRDLWQITRALGAPPLCVYHYIPVYLPLSQDRHRQIHTL